jgi:endoglucanase
MPAWPAMTRRGALAVAGALLAAGAGRTVGAAPSAPPLRRGVNLNWWLALDGHLDLAPDELRQLRRDGFDHVRLPVDPYLLGWRPSDPAGLPTDGAARLDAAVARILGAGLGLVLDVHPGDELVNLLRMRGAADALAPLWGWLAGRLGGLDPGLIAFEIVNEPHRFIDDRKALAGLHEAALAAIRAQAPFHLVLVNGLWDPVLTLRTLTPLPDARVTYAFQFYEPYVVTHQGADWGDSSTAMTAPLRAVPWPAALLDDPLRHVVDPLGDRTALAALRRYQHEAWNTAVLARRVALAAEWGAKHGVPVHCTEFGVMRTYIDPASRLAWLADARAALEAAGLGWTVWELDGLFGIIAGCDDSGCGPTEAGVLVALGLAS